MSISFQGICEGNCFPYAGQYAAVTRDAGQVQARFVVSDVGAARIVVEALTARRVRRRRSILRARGEKEGVRGGGDEEENGNIRRFENKGIRRTNSQIACSRSQPALVDGCIPLRSEDPVTASSIPPEIVCGREEREGVLPDYCREAVAPSGGVLRDVTKCILEEPTEGQKNRGAVTVTTFPSKSISYLNALRVLPAYTDYYDRLRLSQTSPLRRS